MHWPLRKCRSGFLEISLVMIVEISPAYRHSIQKNWVPKDILMSVSVLRSRLQTATLWPILASLDQIALVLKTDRIKAPLDSSLSLPVNTVAMDRKWPVASKSNAGERG